MGKFYTKEQKERAISFARLYGAKHAAITTGIELDAIRGWLEEEENRKKQEKLAKEEARKNRPRRPCRRNPYTEEQKAEALRLVEEIGYESASKELGMAMTTLSRWKKAIRLKAEADQAAQKKEARLSAKPNKAAGKKDAEVNAASDQSAQKKEAERSTRADQSAGKKDAEMNAVPDQTAARKKSAGINLVIQSQDGKEISIRQIAQMVPANTESVYVKAEEHKLYWVSRDGGIGSIHLWEGN